MAPLNDELSLAAEDILSERFGVRVRLENGERLSGSNRQRLLVSLDALAQTTEESDHLRTIGATARDLATRLRALWPPEVHETPCFPAFRETDSGSQDRNR